MYLNAFLVEKFASYLNDNLKGHTLIDAFSTGKYECYLLFNKPLAIRIQFYKGQAYFQKVDFKLIQKTNRLKLFPEIIGAQIEEIYAYPMDRIIRFRVGEEWSLMFYLFGKFSQLSLYKSESFIEHFPIKSKRIDPIQTAPDFDPNWVDGLSLDELHSRVRFLTADDLKNLEKLGFGEGNNLDAWLKYKRLYCSYSSPMIDENSFLPGEFTASESQDLLDALGAYTSHFISAESFKDRKKDLEQELNKKKLILQDRRRKLKENIKNVKQAIGYKEKADLIMAYMHEIKSGMDEITLPSFEGDRKVKIRLKKDLSPQANAQNFYRKAKNEGKRLEYLESSLESVESEIDQINAQTEQMDNLQSLRDLKKFRKTGSTEDTKERLPYKSFSFEGFEIRVGKSSRDNDALLSKYSAKTDIWLHAHGVGGSHVIIRTQKGQEVPQSVLEAAASLAALNSKAKHESLAPVIYTERKYVRKPRKAAPGAVLVEREKLIMAEPSSLPQ